MERIGRVLIVDPAYASGVGHHGDVNAQLLAALERQGWQAECWGDAAVEARGCRGVFSGCGYEDPRHWADLGGTVHLARRLEGQLLAALEGQGPVGGWVLHTVLPFQLLGVARALRHLPAATVMVSLMFPPGETLGGEGGEEAAISNCRVALSALAQAMGQGGHRLRLELPSQQGLELYAPLLESAGLACSGLHPAVVGAGLPVRASAGPGGRPRVLLHWGDLKPGKGRGEALAVVRQLLDGGPLPPPLREAEWLFQVHSQEPLPAAEKTILDQARERIAGFQWLNERVEAERMQALLAGCDGALLAYDPVLYRQRSSGLLWSYGAARWSSDQPAAVVGRPGGWLEREARDLGLGWRSSRDGRWLEDLAAAMEESCAGGVNAAERFTAYGQRMLGEGFAGHVARRLQELQSAESQTIEQG
ncbi:hypothetical protein [Aphanothece minutissima]|uniref:Glycosyltransferase family 1 protein n=1 Tax=Aphanothece cf. minutissima CCALA 015 TaxID=2107695 RepID=A0ABX5F7S0_9CHRO|nr:hypothetical protein [Aphanothece minutissima]PSB36508.1 hypothetical protein C7B81_13100 [Aphanothece cf. minutissima CCALA 015]